jgi:hypothetical protein
MEFGHGRHSCDALAAQLRQLLALACIHIDEAVHIANAEPLYIILRELLPLSAQSTRN